MALWGPVGATWDPFGGVSGLMSSKQFGTIKPIYCGWVGTSWTTRSPDGDKNPVVVK